MSCADPFGNETTIAYDDDLLLPVELTDALGNVVTAEHDYRVLSPSQITDPNANRSFAAYDGLGRVTAVAIGGKSGETDPDAQGDTLEHPTQRFTYDAFAWVDDAKPVSVHGFAREQYYPVDDSAPVQQSVTYADGAGNVLMVKVLAEPGPAPARDGNGALVFAGSPPELQYADTSSSARWVGTGRTVLDNKGNPIKQYEPFFSDRPDYEDEAELLHLGVTPILRYDPLGRLIRTDFPDWTFARVELSPWQTTTHDPSDTVLDSEWYAEREALTGGMTDEDAEIRAAQLTADYAAETPTVEALATDGADEALRVRVQVRAPRRQPHALHATAGEQLAEAAAEQRVAVVEQVAHVPEASVDGIGGSPGDDAHPGLAGVARDPEHLDATRPELDHEQHEVAHDPDGGHHLDGEEVGGCDRVPM